MKVEKNPVLYPTLQMMLKSDFVNRVFLMVFLTAIFGGVNLAIANQGRYCI